MKPFHPPTVYSRANWRFFVQKYCKELIVCKRAKHPNILSIEGVAPMLFEFCIVSQWMVNGNMVGYVTKYPGVNRLELVDLTPQHFDPALTSSQLVGVTRGLDYLHSNEVIHGDLKSVSRLYLAILVE